MNLAGAASLTAGPGDVVASGCGAAGKVVGAGGVHAGAAGEDEVAAVGGGSTDVVSEGMFGGGIDPGVMMPSGTTGFGNDSGLAGGIAAPVNAGIGGVYPTVVVAPATSAVITPSFPARSLAVTLTDTAF